ncbi:peptidase A24 [Bifidobacterium simiarum]|uniref:Peptidase A24 n=1 Tax=Bifidobacterium simiarum TaxID=2045441 RepID=A0A2M9HC46_9BIFI|nr:peptidase A24 [Bifidobacterium simiarum]MBT1166788.1 peptidase A24 [Bifidobacterium simiarum]PJM74376.1 peptidase A24 [Bifidobacterium simiarum]
MPVTVVAVGSAAQLIATAIWCMRTGRWTVLAMSVGLALLCAAIQLALGLLKPGHLGFGDVTCTLLVGLAVGSFGVQTVAVWWLLMGMIGLGMLWICKRRGGDSIPFAPAIVAGGLLAMALQALAL